MKIKLLAAAMASLMVFASCVKDIESASVTNVRNAKAAELNSIAAYNNAMAQAEVITANAEAALMAAQAEYQKAQAELVKAQAELIKVQTEEEKTRLEMLIAQLEVAQAEAAARLEEIARQAELELEQHKLALLKAQQQYNLFAQQLAEQERAHLLAVSAAYTQAVNDYIDLQVEKINAEADIAAFEAGLKNSEEIIDAEIESALAQIAFYDKKIEILKKYISADAAELEAALDQAYLVYYDASLAKEEALDAERKAVVAEATAWEKVTEGKFEAGVESVKNFAIAYFGSSYDTKDGVNGYNNGYGVFVPLWKESYMASEYITYKNNQTYIEDFTPAVIYGDNFIAAIDVEVEAENAKHELSLKNNEKTKAYNKNYAEQYAKAAQDAYPEAMQKEIKKAYDDATERYEAASVAVDEAWQSYYVASDKLYLSGEHQAVYLAQNAYDKANNDMWACQSVIDNKPWEIANYKSDIKNRQWNVANSTDNIENICKPQLKQIADDIQTNNEKLAAAEKTIADFKLDELKQKEYSAYLDYIAHQSAEDWEKYHDAWQAAQKAVNDVLDDTDYQNAVSEVNACKDKAITLKNQADSYNYWMANEQANIENWNKEIADKTALMEAAQAEYDEALSSIDDLKAKVEEADAALQEAIKADNVVSAAVDDLYNKYQEARDKLSEIRNERNNIAVVDYVTEFILTDVYTYDSYSGDYRYVSGSINTNSVEILVPGNNTWSYDIRNSYTYIVEEASYYSLYGELCDKFVELENATHEEIIGKFDEMKQFITDCTSLEEGYLADIAAAETAADNYVTAWMSRVDAYEVYNVAIAEYVAIYEVYIHDADIQSEIDDIIADEIEIVDYVNGLIDAYNDNALTLEIMKAKLPILETKLLVQEKLVAELEAELNALLEGIAE